MSVESRRWFSKEKSFLSQKWKICLNSSTDEFLMPSCSANGEINFLPHFSLSLSLSLSSYLSISLSINLSMLALVPGVSLPDNWEESQLCGMTLNGLIINRIRWCFSIEIWIFIVLLYYCICLVWWRQYWTMNNSLWLVPKPRSQTKE